MVLTFILAPFVLALLLAVGGRWIPASWQHWLSTAAMLALFAALLGLMPVVQAGGPIGVSVPWVPVLGLALDVYLDGLALLFALLITGIGVAVFAYAGYYMQGHRHARRFLVYLSAFAGSMLGVVLAGNVLLLFVCWELTSIFSFLLIGFDEEDPAARAAATKALLITGGGGLALLAGLFLLGTAAGSFSFAALLQTPLQDHAWYNAIALLVFAGCFTKSAQMPFHFWLPGGMTAPTPASAYLHSATMVKAGVYLLARLYPTLGDTALWITTLTIVGALTMLLAAAIALRQHDLKAMLAYATVSWLGALVLLLGLPEYEGYAAALVGLVAHALYKSALFMVAGAIDHAAGTRIIDRLGGLARRMPAAAAITVVSALSMAGVIPLLGFVAKETLLDALLEYHGALAPLLLGGVVAAATLTVTAAAMFAWDVFFRPEPRALYAGPGSAEIAVATDGHSDTALHIHRLPRLMLAGPLLIAALSLLLGLLVEPLVGPLIASAVPIETSLHLFNGFNSVFMLSTGIIGAGTLIFVGRERWRSRRLGWPLSAAAVYDGFLDALNRAGDLLLRLQNGKLSFYLAVILGVVGVLMLLPGFQYLASAQLNIQFRGSTDVLKGTLLLLSLAATLASILFRGHLLAALALGVAGYAVGGIFLLEPGPDVAMVQILVETLGAVLIIVMLSRISERKRRRAADSLWGRGHATVKRDLFISILVGLGVGLFALAAVINRPARDSSVASYYLRNAEAVGVYDVVGSIVTDFRGTDTMVEIAVFAMAAMGVLTVLRLTRPKEQRQAQAEAPGDSGITSLIATPLTRYAATLLLPVAGVIALAQLLYAGDAPGDGFTAGVIGGISVALWYQVFGYTAGRLRRLRAERLIGAGMALAIGNALLPLLWGGNFLEHNNFGDLPLPAGLHFSSTTVFEIAILLTVLGSVITIVNAITNPEGIEQL